MAPDERQQTIQILERIPRAAWRDFLASDEGSSYQARLTAVREAVRHAGRAAKGPAAKPSAEFVDLLGHRLLSSARAGVWIRQQLLEALASRKWQRLADTYRSLASDRGHELHGNASQSGRGSAVMATYWHQGGRWAREFCAVVGFPEILAQTRKQELQDDEVVLPAQALPPLHDFQLDVYAQLRAKLENGLGNTAMLSLPTGAGKTRVAVEAICDHLATRFERSKRNVVLWIAHSSELQQQAWACFRQVWQVAPLRADGAPLSRPCGLHLVRGWGGRSSEDVEIDDEPTVLIAGIDQLASWARRTPDFFERFPRSRLLCVVIDEAHGVITKEYREVLVALGLRAQHEWRPLATAPLVLGLTATPWRRGGDNDDSASLRRFFKHQLLRPELLGTKPIKELQRRRILAKAKSTSLHTSTLAEMTTAQLARYKQFGDLPNDYLRDVGADNLRNGAIIAELAGLPLTSRVLVFACSVEHAGVLALALNRALDPDCAAVVTGKTGRAERTSVIQRFREGGKLRFLVNVGVLTTGFDAPCVDVACITRPTTSAVLYEQMVGRGLRGPLNCGTSVCRVLDVQDENLPGDIQSYARVVSLWDSAD